MQNAMSFVYRRKRLWLALVVICVLREAGAINLSCFSTDRSSESSPAWEAWAPGYAPFQEIVYADDRLDCSIPKAPSKGVVVLERVFCKTSWTTWIPLVKWGSIDVVRVVRLSDDAGMLIAEGRHVYESDGKTMGFCSHRELVEHELEAARRQFEFVLRDKSAPRYTSRASTAER